MDTGESRIGYRVSANYMKEGRGRPLTFRGTARTHTRRLELLRAAYSMRIQ